MYFVPMGEWNPLESDIHTRGRLFNPRRGKRVPKHAGSHRCEVNTLAILAGNFSTLFKVSQRYLKVSRVTGFSQENF